MAIAALMVWWWYRWAPWGRKHDMRSWTTAAQLSLGLMVVALTASPAAARIEQRAGECFERQRGSATISRRLGPCTIYVGTVGFERALYGFIRPGGHRIDGWNDARSSRVVVNGRAGFLYLPPGVASPDQLPKGQFFCLGYEGSDQMTCGRPGG